MFPSLGLEFGSRFASFFQVDLASAGDLANLRYGNSGNSGWDPFRTRSGEKEFVVLSAVEREFHLNFPQWPANSGQRDRLCLQFCPYLAFFADVGEIGGEAVAGIDHRRSEPFLPQNAGQAYSRIGEKMA